MSTHAPQKRHIIVGVDGSPNSHKAIDWAIQYAHAGDKVTLVSAWSPIIVPAEMAVPYTFDDAASRTVLDNEAKRVTSVATARGHGAVMGLLLGSVADYVSRHAKVPVVIVPVG